MRLLRDFNVIGKRVLVRCDFNVPIDKKGKILDDFRIRQTLPTINYLIKERAKIILMSHLGDPNGEVVQELKLDKVAERLAEYLKFSVAKTDDCIGPSVESDSNSLEPGGVMLLENLRFHKEELENDENFSKKLMRLGDIYVNDAFGVCHRNHASVAGVAELLTNCAGLLLEKEIEALNRVLKNPERPLVAIIGGKKVETKTKLLDNILRRSDSVIISGLMTKEISDKKIKLQFPEKIIIPAGNLESLDIDARSIQIFKDKIMKAKTIFWNGPFGKFEERKYSKGTLAIANAIVESNAYAVVGGGETVEFLNKHGMMDKFSHVSTGGGAMLAYMSGDKLPGLEVLS